LDKGLAVDAFTHTVGGVMVWTEQRAVSYRQETDAQFLRALESVCAWHACPKARMITDGRARFVQEDPQGYLERVQRQEDKRKRKREGGNDVGEPDDDDADDDDDDDDDSGARTPRSSKVRLRPPPHPTPHTPTPPSYAHTRAWFCSGNGPPPVQVGAPAAPRWLHRRWRRRAAACWTPSKVCAMPGGLPR
jgi:hypothetical protein